MRVSNALRKPARIEVFAFVAITLVSIGLQHLQGGGDADAGSVLDEAIWGAAYAFAFLGLVVERKSLGPVIRRSLPLLAIVAVALLSTLWSYDPMLTLRRSFGLFGSTAIALYLVSRYDLETFLNILIQTINVAALISLLIIVLLPELGIMHDRYQGAWQGLFLEKNRLGGVMEIGITTMLLRLYSAKGRSRLSLLAWVVVCLVLLVGSRSVTPLVALLLVLMTLSCMFRLRRSRVGFALLLASAALFVVGLCASSIGFGPADIPALFGRDATLTGRTEIWAYALQYIGERPLLGYGYQVFWDPEGPVNRYLLSDLGWEPTSAHNGFLEVALGFGALGLSLFIAFLIEAGRRSVSFFRNNSDRLSAWPVLTMLSLVIMNFADPTFILFNDLRWLLFVVAFLYSTIDSYKKQPNEDFSASFASRI